jgi:hypothetical protein
MVGVGDAEPPGGPHTLFELSSGASESALAALGARTAKPRRARTWSPLSVLGRLNRARVAERLEERDQAAGLYQYVLDA